jgi:glycosyltransferase involved in cell wall biosynthesis
MGNFSCLLIEIYCKLTSKRSVELKIVLLSNSYLPSLGGREIAVHQIARHLAKMGQQVRVVGPAGWIKNRKILFGYPVHRWPTLRGFFNEQVWFLQILLDVLIFGCDIIHAHNTYPMGYIASKLIKIFRRPLVVTPHGEDINVIPELRYGLWLNHKLRPKIRQGLKASDTVTAISSSVYASLIRVGVPPSKIRKIPNGIDFQRFKNAENFNVREWLNISSDSRLILTIGNYRPLKGQEYLIQSMPEILRKIPNAHLVIVGKNQEALTPYIKELGLGKNITLAGIINYPLHLKANTNKIDLKKTPDRLASLLCSSDIYVSSSVDPNAEGLSIALLEAMASGLPVVATDIPGSREVIKNGREGFLVPVADFEALGEKIAMLLGDRDLHLKIRQNVKAAIGSFDWNQIARKYIGVYREISNKFY